MKKLLTILLLTLLFPTSIYANAGAEASVSANPYNTHQGIYFNISSDAELVGKTVTDDVFIIASDSEVNGVVKGDLIAIAEDNQIKGIVEQDLRVIGGDVHIDAQVFGNVSILANSVTISKDSIFYKNLNIAANNIKIEGDVLGKADLYAFHTEINTITNDQWKVRTQDLKLGDSFDPQANFTYYSPSQTQIATPSANIEYVESDLQDLNVFNDFEGSKFWQYFSFTFRLFKTTYLLFSLLVGFILLKFIAPSINLNHKFTGQEIRQTLRVGFKIFILWILLISLLFGLIITIPGAIILSSFLIFALFLSTIITSFLIGRDILFNLKLGRRRGFALLLGLVINYLLSMIPLINLIYLSLIYSFGLGLIYRQIKPTKKKK